MDKKDQNHLTDLIIVKITQARYIKKVLIPLFNSLSWKSKKIKDYEDWKIIFQLKEKGLHYLPEGFIVVKSILDQMNRRRLSSNERAEKRLNRISLAK